MEIKKEKEYQELVRADSNLSFKKYRSIIRMNLDLMEFIVQISPQKSKGWGMCNNKSWWMCQCCNTLDCFIPIENWNYLLCQF